MRDFLIYTSAGESANVNLWAKSSLRSYDIWITNYSDIDGLHRCHADYYNERKGAKFPNFSWVLSQHYDHLSRYKAIMVADDDIIISCKDLDALFQLLVEKQAGVVVPAFSRLGKISHDTTVRKLASDYRITNFAEVTCPIIRIDLLLDFMSVYDPSAVECHGVDWWYLNHWGEKVEGKIIISDSHYCHNPRDRSKKSGVREIDRHYSEEQRQARWNELKQKLNIGSFPKRISGAHPKPLPLLLRHLPGYAYELAFSFMWDKLLPFFRRPIKRVVNHWRRPPVK